jgi:hypothetical protein
LRASIGKRRGLPLATIGIVVLLSAIFASPAAAVDTPIEASPLALDFGTVAAGTTAPPMTVEVTNTSTSPFGPINIFGGAPPTPEFNASQTCQGTTLAGGASCQVNYTFSPGAPGQFSDSSNFTISQTMNQADGEDFSIALAGRSGPPTITGFAPTIGNVGTPVVITGDGFLGTSAVEFNGVSATFTEDSDAQITTTVPAGATTGPITVTAAAGTVTSATNFIVVVGHVRKVTLALDKDLVATGQVSATDDFAQCESGVTVKVQRKREGKWRTIDSDVTGPTGNYRESLRDRAGKYRALIGRLVLNEGADVCDRDVSLAKRHTPA